LASKRSLHINALKLKAAFNCFAADLRDCDVLLRVDNTTALAYINKFSIQFPHLSTISAQIWRWCEDRNIFICAAYISSTQNYIIADAESRIAELDTEWSLSEEAFHKVLEIFRLFNVDLFTSLNNNKCESYVSWFPDPGAIAVDTFTLS